MKVTHNLIGSFDFLAYSYSYISNLHVVWQLEHCLFLQIQIAREVETRCIAASYTRGYNCIKCMQNTTFLPCMCRENIQIF